MASGRFLNVSISEDERLNSLSIVAEYVYLKTIPHLDRDGCISGKAGYLWGKVCPLREELFGETKSIIEEWVHVGLVVPFETTNGPALFFPGFLKNNTLSHYHREKPSRYSPPPGYACTPKGIIATNGDGGSTPKNDNVIVQESVQDQVQDKVLLNRIEGNRIEGKGREASVTVQESVQDQVQEYIQPPNPPLSFRPEHKHATSYIEEAKALGIGPEPFRLMVDAVLDATGKRHKADSERNDLTLNQAKDTVIQVAKMGYVCIEDIQRILHSWTKNDWRGDTAPTFGQVVDHASAMIDGKHITRKQTAATGVDAEKAAVKETSKRIQMDALRTAQKFNVVQEVPDGTPPF